MYRLIGKRALDCFLSLAGLVVFCIPMAIIALAIKLDSPGPVIFRQERLGKGKERFIIYKFRTMCDHAYEMGGLVTRSDDARITRVGAVLRRTSMDELPQMINILKGEMSIIGPRPILPVEFADYEDNERYGRRFDVLPGMFCTIDIVNRAPDRALQFEMDADYADRIGFLEDVKTFFKILRVVASGENVYREEVGNG